MSQSGQTPEVYSKNTVLNYIIPSVIKYHIAYVCNGQWARGGAAVGKKREKRPQKCNEMVNLSNFFHLRCSQYKNFLIFRTRPPPILKKIQLSQPCPPPPKKILATPLPGGVWEWAIGSRRNKLKFGENNVKLLIACGAYRHCRRHFSLFSL